MGTSLFGEEHHALAASVRRFVAERILPSVGDWERAGTLPPTVRALAGELGYLEAGLEDPLSGLVIAEGLGGSGSSGVWSALLTTAAGVLPLLAAATVGQTAGLREEVAAGRVVVALALWEPGLADLSKVTTRAVAGPDGWRLTGSKAAVLEADQAEAALVLAAVPATDAVTARPERGLVPESPALFLASTRGKPGWRPVEGAPPLGPRAAPTGDVALERLPAVPIGLGADAAWQAQRRLWLMQAAAAVADTRRTWERTCEYAANREVFGRPVSTFQTNRHALAQMLTRLVAAERLVHDAAFRLAGGQDAAWIVAATRYHAECAAAAVTDRCLQLHGGYGYSLEYDVQRSWRDSRALMLDGTSAALRAQIEEGLLRG
jgi:acyl-CoA dehydrogenase